MTPFDAAALLVMLLTFYPVVGPGALAQARRDRPDYFAGGELVGHSGDAMRLPDGRVFDLIFQVGSPAQRWQVLDVTGGGGDPTADDPFRLEDGPLTPIDLTAYPPPDEVTLFRQLAAGALDGLGAADDVIGLAHATIAEASIAGPFADGTGRDLEWAEGAAGNHAAALVRLYPIDEIDAGAALDGSIDARRSAYDEPAPDGVPEGEVPDLPNPGQDIRVPEP